MFWNAATIISLHWTEVACLVINLDATFCTWTIHVDIFLIPITISGKTLIMFTQVVIKAWLFIVIAGMIHSYTSVFAYPFIFTMTFSIAMLVKFSTLSVTFPRPILCWTYIPAWHIIANAFSITEMRIRCEIFAFIQRCVTVKSGRLLRCPTFIQWSLWTWICDDRRLIGINVIWNRWAW